MLEGMIAIARVHAPDDDVRRLVEDLEATLAAKYLPEQRHGLALDALFEPNVRFFVARAEAWRSAAAASRSSRSERSERRVVTPGTPR